MGYQRHARKVFIRDKGRCVYCHRKVFLPRFALHKNVELIRAEGIYVLCKIRGELRVFAMGTMDHVIPQNQKGSDDPENLVLACATCNMNREICKKEHSPAPTLEEFIQMVHDGKICGCGNKLKKHGKICVACASGGAQNKRCADCGNAPKKGKVRCRRCAAKVERAKQKAKHLQPEYYI